MFARLREEAPLYYNEQYDFYALSRYDDVERGLVDRDTYISGRGGILEIIKAGIQMPPGILIFEDPPTHTMHRGLLSRVFTPRQVTSLEPKIREFCALSLDPLVGRRGFDFIADLGAQMPMRVDQHAARDPRVRPGGGARPHRPQPAHRSRASRRRSQEDFVDGTMFAEYLDWRAEHPSDDIMTQLHERGVRGRDRHDAGTLRREEILTYLTVVAGAGNETTTRLIGWTGKVLAEHPDQRRELVDDPSLIPNAIEELLRFEPPAPHVGRYVREAGRVPRHDRARGQRDAAARSAPANRDDRRFPDADRFDIHREIGQHLTFGYGAHFCLGAALARLEGRIALEEVLKRFPEWDVDWSQEPHLAPTSTVRGWESMPVVLP